MKNKIEVKLPVVFDNVNHAISTLNLDRRHKWFEFMGVVVYHHACTIICTGCDGGGCSECGYHGKCRSGVPISAIHPQTGNPVKVKISVEK